MFNKLMLFTLMASIISSCAPSQRVTAYEDDEIYEGYPCVPNCHEFKKGFDTAKNQQLTQLDSCPQEVSPFGTGCKAYVTEYQLEKKEADHIQDQLSFPQ